MAQADYDIANQAGAAFRAELNSHLAAIVSNNSGATAPATTFAYQWWADTTTGLLKIRNAANSAWVTVGTLASTNLGLAALASPTFTGTVTIPALSLTTDLAIADGGTGASTAAAAFAALKQAASTTATGVVELATDSERLAGTDTTRAVTPASLAYGLVNSTNGQIWHSGGALEVWGTQAVNTDIPSGGLEVEIIFPLSFPSAIHNCVATVYNYAASGINIFAVEVALTTSSVKYRVYEGSSAVQSSWGIRWRALGK